MQIQLSNVSFIDVYIPSTKVIIEQKSIGKDLTKGIKQSDGTWLTPMQQMIRYSNAMNYDEMPRWGISCNFQEFMEPTPEHPSKWYSPSETVAALMKMYQELCRPQ